MQLSPVKLNRLANNFAQLALWRQADQCPCESPQTGAALAGCPACHGLGWTWRSPVPVSVAISGQKVQRAWATFGLYENGDVVVTLPSDNPVYEIGEFARVLLQNTTSPFSRVYVRGANDTLNPEAIESIDRVHWLDAESVQVNGGIPVVDDGGVLLWSSGEPPAGQQYTITGREHPEYFVWGEFPQDRAHHRGEPLPRRVVMRRFDLFGR